jgi:ribosomal protein S18 acetylase RimI-like enzyme
MHFKGATKFRSAAQQVLRPNALIECFSSIYLRWRLHVVRGGISIPTLAAPLGQIKAALNAYLLVAETNHELVGFISGSLHRSAGVAVIPAGAIYLEIDNLYILPEYRRQGIGSGLVTKCLVQAKETGVAYALLYSAAKDMHSVLRFYEQHKFLSWNVQMFRQL